MIIDNKIDVYIGCLIHICKINTYSHMKECRIIGGVAL